MLVYTDSPGKRIGFVDITDPAKPEAGGHHGARRRADLGRSSATRCRRRHAEENKQNPSGHVAVVDVATKTVVANCDLGGQPNSVAAAADKAFLAIASRTSATRR